MTSLTDELFAQLEGAPLQQISQQLGIGKTQAAGAVSAALPLLIGALGKNASQPQGAEALFGALQKDHAGGGGIGDLLGMVLGWCAEPANRRRRHAWPHPWRSAGPCRTASGRSHRPRRRPCRAIDENPRPDRDVLSRQTHVQWQRGWRRSGRHGRRRRQSNCRCPWRDPRPGTAAGASTGRPRRRPTGRGARSGRRRQLGLGDLLKIGGGLLGGKR